ncbi:BspA family leucine-rich repeat surface protein [Cytophaga aurantiaca]|uniref:BspA family leucine-rich repeat surface protein n=1 Tax=Cytophaga aurantiaca TaxID=29530 RepID=UPI0003A41024|nr:BspA family leucine-rich repeat surface protein [Cytophaga aurantiaca]
MGKLKLFFIGLIFMVANVAHAQMVLEYDLLVPNEQITLSLKGTVDVQVDWGDGSALEVFTTEGNKTHTYVTSGIKTVTISGILSHYSGSPYRLTKVLSWDGLGLTDLSYAFQRAEDLVEVPATLPSTVTDLSYMFEYALSFNSPIGTWNTASVTNMQSMFSDARTFNQPIGNWNTAAVKNMGSMFNNAYNFNQPIGSWNTSSVTNMRYMFATTYNFNQPIDSWNTSAVTNMEGMFYDANFNQPIGSWNTAAVTNMNSMFWRAEKFNQPIGNWNTSAVTDMGLMFAGATAFNQPIGNWNTGAVTQMYTMFAASAFNQPIGDWNTVSVKSMAYMFQDTYNFNQPIGNWNTSSVTDMYAMFQRATTFNQSIGNWNTGSVTDMRLMFSDAVAFNQPLGNWNVTSVTDMYYMFNNVALCKNNYDAILYGWSVQSVKSGVNFDGGKSKYSVIGNVSRSALLSKGWVINDGGLGITDDVACTTTDTEEVLTENSLILFPNPTKDKLYIALPKSSSTVITCSVYSHTGNLIFEKNIQMGGLQTELDLGQIPQGLYLLRIKTNDESIVKSFVKE